MLGKSRLGWEKEKQKRGRGVMGESHGEEVCPLGRANKKKKGVAF